MPAALGLTTYRANNNIKVDIAPACLSGPPACAARRKFSSYSDCFAVRSPDRFAAIDPFQGLGIQSVLGTGTPADLALSAIVACGRSCSASPPSGILIGYFFNDAIIHMATGAKPVSRRRSATALQPPRNPLHLAASRRASLHHRYRRDERLCERHRREKAMPSR